MLFWDFNQSPDSTLFLAGVGRSGTTWLADLINHENDYRVIFEPFNPHRVPEARSFEYYQYMRPNDLNPNLREQARLVLAGRLHNAWTDSENRKRFSRKRLVKEIRAGLMLKWLHDNFQDMPLVFLLRHPFAVANSWLQLNWGREDKGTRTDLDIYFSQAQLVEDHLQPFVQMRASLSTPFEHHVLGWCILNYVPFRQLKRNDVHLVFYERLCLDPDAELKALFTFLGTKWNRSIFSRLRRPSAQARRESEVMTGGNLTEGWRSTCPRNGPGRASGILAEFGLDDIYTEDPLPDVDAAQRLLDS